MADNSVSFNFTAYYEDIKIIGINSAMVDYKMAWNINKTLGFHFVRQTDIPIGNNDYSFYYYTTGSQTAEGNIYDLVSIMRQGEKWISLSPSVDYMLIIRNEIWKEKLEGMVTSIRSIKGVNHAFIIECNKALGPFMETIELHEISIQEKLSARRKLSDIKQELLEKQLRKKYQGGETSVF